MHFIIFLPLRRLVSAMPTLERSCLTIPTSRFKPRRVMFLRLIDIGMSDRVHHLQRGGHRLWEEGVGFIEIVDR